MISIWLRRLSTYSRASDEMSTIKLFARDVEIVKVFEKAVVFVLQPDHSH